MYLIKLRSAGNGVLSVADLNVNGNYFYENAPIYFSNCECEIPADGHEYATMTNCNTPGTDDPMLFIEGKAAGNVVGFNDDGPRSKLNQYNLSNRGFIHQVRDTLLKRRAYMYLITVHSSQNRLAIFLPV